MKRAMIIMLAFFAMSTLSAQQSVEKTLVKPVNLYGNTNIDVQLNGVVTVKEWSNDHAQIEMNITAYGVNSHVLKSLVAAGRYNIKVDASNDKIVISSPNLAKALKVRGKQLKDEVKYLLYVPKASIVQNESNTNMTSIN